MSGSRVSKLKRLRDNAPGDLGSAEGQSWVNKVSDFFDRELDDINTAHEILAIADGATPASDQMNARERRAEILKLVQREVDFGAEPLRATPPPESETVKAARINRSAVIWAAAIAAIAALLGALIGAYVKGWLSGE